MSEFSLSQNKIIDDMKSFILCYHIDLRTVLKGSFIEIYITKHIKVFILIYYAGQEERCSLILMYLYLIWQVNLDIGIMYPNFTSLFDSKIPYLIFW